ncbi:MAG: ROK family protein [Spirochaetes bacterium]|nr:ROK family protein [Spirochaetota bacterium]
MAHGEKINKRKENKRKHIVDIFRQHSTLSKAEAKRYSGYSMDTVMTSFKILKNTGIIVPTEGKQKDKGRKALFYTLNHEKQVYLGITFNQKAVYTSIVSFSNKVLATSKIGIPGNITKEEFTSIIVQQIDEVLSKNPVFATNLVAVGCTVPGDIDTKNGILRSYTLMPQLKDFNLMSLLSSKFPNTRIFFDHNISSMISYILSTSDINQRYDRIMVVSARAASALGLIYKGAIVNSRGEIGHIKVSNENHKCICGRNGCLDCYFSYEAFVNLLKGENIIDENECYDNIIIKLNHHYTNRTKGIFEKLDIALKYFSEALLDVINVFSPDYILLTGDLFEIYNDPVAQIDIHIKDIFHDTGYITMYKRALIEFQSIKTEAIAHGVCLSLIKQDWGYQV